MTSFSPKEPRNVYFELCRQIAAAGAPQVTFTTWHHWDNIPIYSLEDLFRLLESARDRWVLRIERDSDSFYHVTIWRSGEDVSTRSIGQGVTLEIAMAWAILLAAQGCRRRKEPGFF